jgi:hypothetical protein
MLFQARFRVYIARVKKSSQTTLRQACLLSRTGKAEEALDALRAGVQGGSWWSPRVLDQEADLAGARLLPGWSALRDECERRYWEKQARSHPECFVLSPASATWEPRSLFIIHGRGATAAEFSRHWQPLLDEGWTLIVPQSSQVYDSEGWCWDNAELAHAEIRQHWEDCRRKRGMDLEGMIVAGASQGGRLAVEAANEAGLRWLSVIPSFPKRYDAGPLTAMPTHTVGAILLGEHDPAMEGALPVISQLESGGVKVIVKTMQGVGHELPDDFCGYAGEALRALLGD